MRVIHRRKGKNDYYYLQHSYRRDGKVVTKERYLGKEIPENLAAIKHDLLQEQQNLTAEKLAKIQNEYQKEWQTTPPSAKEKALEELAIIFTYNTNAIEGSTITLDETRSILEDQTAPNKSLKDIYETEAHAKVFLGMLKTQEAISHELLLSWHKGLFMQTKQDIAGRYRNWPVRVGPYMPPDSSKIEQLMTQLIEFANTSDMHPVEVALRSHYMFEKIHPFGDGNGRVGRLLMNYILWKNVYPMFVVKNSKKRDYYKALNKPEEGFRNYLMRQYLVAFKKSS